MIRLDRTHTGGFVDWFWTHEGVHPLDPDARTALYGGCTDA